jgi:hypothetical protein
MSHDNFKFHPSLSDGDRARSIFTSRNSYSIIAVGVGGIPMSTTNHDRHHAAIRGTLARSAGDSPDASAIAEATLNTWRRMADRLAPVIGVRGVDALFGRSLHVTSKTFPWLAMAENDGSNAALLTGLKARLAGQEPAAAAEASDALLGNFTELLTTLIGASLTERLLAPVWLPSPPESEQESVP